MSRSRTAAIAALLVLAAVIGGTVIDSVAAATSSGRAAAGATAAPVEVAPPAGPATGQATPSPACTAFRAAFAAALGVAESALTPAAKTAAKQVVDSALAAGRITATQADRIKARIDEQAGDGCGILSGRAAAAAGALGVVRDGIDAAAAALKLSRAQLVAKVRAGQTLQSIASDAGVPYETVTAAVIAAVKQDLDAAVAKGTIRQVRADRVLGRLQQNLAEGRFRNAEPAVPPAPAASQPAGS
jgi:ribosomal protein S20